MKPAMLGQELIKAQEVVFSICMGLVAFLSHDNPLLTYPHILWTFAIFMTFNLFYHVLLRKYGYIWIIPLISIAANSLIISLILGFSGGQESYFWPMYLLPIFTACLHLERRHVFLAAIIPASFLSYFYLESIWQGEFLTALELFTKIVVLGFSAGVTMQVAFRERTSRKALEETRVKLDHLAKTLNESQLREQRMQKMKTLSQVVGGILHSLNNPLMVISGSTELLLMETATDSPQRRDLERIDAAARACGQMTRELLNWISSDSMAFEDVNTREVLEQSLHLFEHELQQKRLVLSKDLPAELPILRLSPPHIQQVILAILFKVTDQMAPHGRVEVMVTPKSEGVDVHIVCYPVQVKDPLDGLQTCDEILVQHGGYLDIRHFQGGIEYMIHLNGQRKT